MVKNKELMGLLKNAIPDLVGFIETKRLTGTVLLTGSVFSTDKDVKDKIEKIVADKYPNELFIYSIDVNSTLTVVDNGAIESTENEKDRFDKLKVIYMGLLPINAITASTKYKDLNKDNFTKIDNCIKVLDFIAPIILDSNLNIIDGNLRYEIARENKKLKVPVVIVDAADNRTEFLRLILNRTSEFQRWVYSDVDEFVDANPQIQPLAEPLGFFGNNLLPESFFSNSMLNYEIDVFNAQQARYRQETTIQDWAELRKAEIQAEYEKAQAAKKKGTTPRSSLFDLAPKPEDFLKTYDPKEEISKNVKEMRELAEVVTNNFDETRRKEMEAKGIDWHKTRRNTKQLAADTRTEFIDEINSFDLDEEFRESILSRLDDFNSLKELKELLSKEVN